MANIAIFVPHKGCPNKCSFCEQRHITGQQIPPDADFVKNTLKTALYSLKEKSFDSEIAFFGGSFTAIDEEYMLELLESTKPYIDNFKGIRISTRPDAISADVLGILKNYKVTSIELGAQSMSDIVLEANERGHNAEAVIKASELIKSYGFSLGLQMMTGLYMSNDQLDIYTAEEFIKLSPDTVRIYPTVVLENTTLAERFRVGQYIPPDVSEAVKLCAKLIPLFENKGIKVIRVGLHDSESLKSNMIGGAFHPAFRELCEGQMFYDNIITGLNNNHIPAGNIKISVPKSALSKVIGQKSVNKNKLIALGYNPKFSEDNTLAHRQVSVTKG